MRFKSTREVAGILGVNPSRLSRAIWDRRIESPTRGPGGAFLWTLRDIQHASWVLLGHGLDDGLIERMVAGQEDTDLEAEPGGRQDDRQARNVGKGHNRGG